MDQQRSKIPVAPLTDPEQDWLIPRRILAWHQPDTGSKLPTIAELLAITIGGYHRRGDLRTDALDRPTDYESAAPIIPGNSSNSDTR